MVFKYIIFIFFLFYFFYTIYYECSSRIFSFYNKKIPLFLSEKKLSNIIRDKNKEHHFYTSYIKMEKLFKFFNISFVAQGGTLLGAYRDGKFLPWDYDMDFCIDIKNNNIIKSKKFKKKASELELEFMYIKPNIIFNVPNHIWKGIGGIKVSNKGKWYMGQIDVFFFSNAHDENVYYLGNDGKPHGWTNENYKKEDLFPLKFIKLKFPTINKTIEIPTPSNPETELARNFGKDFKDSVPKKYTLWYHYDNLLH